MNTDLVWYVAYGSNLSNERFLCYIRGGTPEGSDKAFEGCRDTTLPRDVKPEILDRELYFAENSKGWQGMGVSFIRNESSNTSKTYVIKYLITREQLEDLAKQVQGEQSCLISSGRLKKALPSLDRLGMANCCFWAWMTMFRYLL